MDDSEIARYLASYIFEQFGTIVGLSGKQYKTVLDVVDEQELYEVIKEFYEKLP